jgi:CheY-like chemotaxis protein
MLSILQVEDDENDVFLLRHAFEHAGVTTPIHITRDGQEAIEYLSGEGKYADRKLFPVPSLIILDVKMPRRSGLEVLRWIRSHQLFSCIPVVMLSSSAQPRDIDQAYEAGANAFVVKPATNPARIRLASAIKLFWLEFNEPSPKCAEHEMPRAAKAVFRR